MRRITVTLSLLQGVRDTGRSLNYSEQRAAPPLHATTAHHVGQPSPVNSGPTHHGTAITKAHCSSVSPHPAESRLSAIIDTCCPSCIYPDTCYPNIWTADPGRAAKKNATSAATDCASATRSCCLQPAVPHRLHPLLAVRRPQKKKKKKGGLTGLEYTQNSEF